MEVRSAADGGTRKVKTVRSKMENTKETEIIARILVGDGYCDTDEEASSILEAIVGDHNNVFCLRQ